jgi:hypothetical protein
MTPALEDSCESQGRIAPAGLGGMNVTQALIEPWVIRTKFATKIADSEFYPQLALEDILSIVRRKAALSPGFSM